ncbi:MAG: response regulator transcription factor [Solirubrobacteraceae bacterium]
MNLALAQSRLSADTDSRAATVLLVESGASLGGEIVEQLRADGYRVALARTAEHARALARAQPIRAVLLGTLDTSRGALDLLEEVRGSAPGTTGGSMWEGCLPTIVLSPSAEQIDLLRAFELGADDFIAHPERMGWEGHSHLELRARLKALLRRAEGFPGARLLRVGPLDIDTHAHLVRIAGAPVELCRLEYELLVHLARNPSGVCSKHELLRTVWDQRVSSGVRTVDSHASRLRRKLDAAGAPGFVVNVWGVGYRLT